MFAKWRHSLCIWVGSMLLIATGCVPVNLSLTGAGASFPYPLYAKWAATYQKTHPVNVNYQSIGSGGGIKQIKAKVVDFGASDMPLSLEELTKAGLIQFPAIIGAVVPVMQVSGITSGQLKLTGEVLADIYLGTIKRWDAPEIQALNPGFTLPALDITVVYRSDGSGTSYVFTRYLSKVSQVFKAKMGEGSALKWPVGIGGKGNEGVAAYVGKIKGAIGYVEYAYVKKNKLSFIQLKNHDGVFVMPGKQTFQAAAESAKWADLPGFSVDLTNTPGKDSWPITSASFILLHQDQSNPQKGKAILDFFAWSFVHGAQDASNLDYIPLPDSVITLIQASWTKKVTDGKSEKPIW